MMGQPLVEEAQRDAIAPGVEAADRRFEVGRRPRHLADREGRLRGTDLEVDPVRRRCGAFRRAAAARRRALGERQRQLERGELVGGGVASAGERGRLDGRGPRPPRVVADQPVPGDGRRRSAQAHRQGRVVAGPGDRQQVACHGPSDRLRGGRRCRRRSRPGSRWRAPRCEPAHRSASSTPSPARGPVTERGADRSVSTSNAAATAASCAASERPVGERQQAQRPGGIRASGSPGRAMTSSSNEPVSDALGSSRRAASSSSATSGRPPDRSATRSSRLADARSPSMPSIRAASSSRSSGGSVRRSGGRGPATIAPEVGRPRVVAPDDVRLVRADDRQPLFARDPGQERDSARVAASARCRSSMTSTTGCCSPSRPSSPRTPSRVRAWRRSGAVGSAAATGTPIAARRGAEIGQQPDDLGRRRTRGDRPGRPSGGRAGPGRWPGRSGRTARRRWPARPSRAGRSSARAARASGRSPRRGSG